jgi:hypothetical protein
MKRITALLAEDNRVVRRAINKNLAYALFLKPQPSGNILPYYEPNPHGLSSAVCGSQFTGATVTASPSAPGTRFYTIDGTSVVFFNFVKARNHLAA